MEIAKHTNARHVEVPFPATKKAPADAGAFGWRRWWDSNPRARLRTKRFRVVLVTTTSIHLHILFPWMAQWAKAPPVPSKLFHYSKNCTFRQLFSLARPSGPFAVHFPGCRTEKGLGSCPRAVCTAPDCGKTNCTETNILFVIVCFFCVCKLCTLTLGLHTDFLDDVQLKKWSLCNMVSPLRRAGGRKACLLFAYFSPLRLTLPQKCCACT